MGRTKLKGQRQSYSSLLPRCSCRVQSGDTGEGGRSTRSTQGADVGIDFSPTPAHSPDLQNGGKFLGWIIPTLRTSEFTVLQTVGLDAAVVSRLLDR